MVWLATAQLEVPKKPTARGLAHAGFIFSIKGGTLSANVAKTGESQRADIAMENCRIGEASTSRRSSTASLFSRIDNNLRRSLSIRLLVG
jgi:hypothetical protein